MSVALVAIAKNEELYVQDFLNQYRKLGFSAIYLYDNSSHDSHNLRRFALSEPDFRVHVIPWTDSSHCKQPNAQNHFLKNYAGMYSHAAVMDLDEIIVLKKHTNILEFCNDHCREGAVGLNWYLFGDSGLAKYEPRPFQERFVMRQADVNPHVKYIFRVGDATALDIHKPILRRGRQHDTNGQPIVALSQCHNPGGPTDVAVVHHYFTKSLEEFMLKRDRGRATQNAKRTMDDFSRHNFNQVKDTSAWTFFAEANEIAQTQIMAEASEESND